LVWGGAHCGSRRRKREKERYPQRCTKKKRTEASFTRVPLENKVALNHKRKKKKKKKGPPSNVFSEEEEEREKKEHGRRPKTRTKAKENCALANDKGGKEGEKRSLVSFFRKKNSLVGRGARRRTDGGEEKVFSTNFT